MALGFLDPGLLSLAAAAAVVPLAAHLIARTRPPEKRFPTVEFLRRANRRVWRMRRPRDLLLLALRTLAIVALALAFARPLWLSGAGAAGAEDAKHVVLLVDRSGSMGALAGGQSQFSLAKSRAVEALRGAGKLESVNLVWIDAVPDAVYPGMGRLTEPLEAAIDQASVTGENGDTAAALRLALEQLQPLEGNRELIIVSDFQASSWSESLPALPDSIHLFLLPVGEGVTGNLSLSRLELDPASPLVGESVRVTGEVRNQGEERRTVDVSVTLGEQRVVREVVIEPRSESAFFAELPPPENLAEFSVRASLQNADDELAADDDRWVVSQVREPLRVALLFEPDSVSEIEEDIWNRLLASLSWTRKEEDPGRAEILVAAGNSDALGQTAGRILESGGSVIYRPSAAGAGPASLLADLPIDGNGQWESRLPTDPGWTMSIPASAENDPLFRLFSRGDYGNPAGGSTHQRWRSPPVDPGEKKSDLLMAYEDGVPALWRSPRGSGHLWWWNLPLDPNQSTWPRQPAFLPLVGEAMLLSRSGYAAPPHAEVAPGQWARWEPIVFPEGGEIRLVDADSRPLDLAENSGGQSLSYRSAEALQPGLHRWVLYDAALDREMDLALTAVNFPTSEMDLRPAPASVLEAWAETRLDVAERDIDWNRFRNGVPLWPWLVGFGLSLLGVEALILLRAASRRRSAGPSLSASP